MAKPPRNTLSVRAACAKVIFAVLNQGQSLSTLLPHATQAFSAQDSALAQEICFGVCRTLPRLERVLALMLDKPLRGKTRIVHALLLVSLYQLLYLRTATHAVVDEAVKAAPQLKANDFRGLINGVLRRFLREQTDLLAQADKHWHSLHPDWFINKLKPVYPNWREILEANNQRPPMWLRVNAQQSTRESYHHALGDSAEPIQTDAPPQAIRLVTPKSVQQLPRFEQGASTVQDASAQWAAHLLEPQNGEWILDACAAPGGKTTHLLELAPQANVWALDIEPERLARVEANLVRLGQTAHLLCADAANPDAWLPEGAQFDRILLDAPCSATGVIRRHPDIKWLRQASDIEQLVALQATILRALWTRLKPNGTLLYATCSILPEENTQQIQRFLAETPDAVLEPLLRGGSDGVWQILPSPTGGDGFFYAKLRKRAHA